MKFQQPVILENGAALFIPPDPIDGMFRLTRPDVYGIDSVQRYPLGTKLVMGDWTFRYAQADAALANVARLVINSHYAPGCTGHEDEDGVEGALYAAGTAGDTYVDVADTEARAKNYYEGAYLVYFASGHYVTQRIKKSDAGNGSTHVRCYLSEPLKYDVSTSIGITAYLSPFSGIKAAQSTNQEYEAFMGLNLVTVTSGYYFWLLRNGPAWVTAHGGTWPGSAAHYRDVFAHMDGTVDPSSVADPTSGYQRVGYLISSTVSSYGDAFVWLQFE